MSNQNKMPHKAGFVNIIGNPNVGKSTIMNSLVGEKLSIITSKAQTTRHRIMGIVNGKDFQIVYSDTPGIIVPYYKLQESMMKSVNLALIDADIILYITDVIETADKNETILNKLQNIKIPILLVINKIDLSGQEKTIFLIKYWQEKLPN
ncbi:MAG: GTPase Era, partial [Bacteroidales bacterium]|nr:GTPase Era [Bacteroidales bacterium]